MACHHLYLVGAVASREGFTYTAFWYCKAMKEEEAHEWGTVTARKQWPAGAGYHLQVTVGLIPDHVVREVAAGLLIEQACGG